MILDFCEIMTNDPTIMAREFQSQVTLQYNPSILRGFVLYSHNVQ